MNESAPRKRGSLFWIGTGLMIVSFALYPSYLLIAFLPISPQAKAATVVASWVLSWALFTIGSTLAGKEGFLYLKRLFVRRRDSAAP